jgi:hypothetical protein
MTSTNIKKTGIFTLGLIGFIGLVVAFYQLQLTSQSASIPQVPDKPAYQTGKAFEVIEPEKSANVYINKTPESLISEADQIIANANAIVAKHGLGEAELTAQERREVDERIAAIKQQLDELEQQLD